MVKFYTIKDSRLYYVLQDNTYLFINPSDTYFVFNGSLPNDPEIEFEPLDGELYTEITKEEFQEATKDTIAKIQEVLNQLTQ